MRNRYKNRLDPINLNQRRHLELNGPGLLVRAIDLITISDLADLIKNRD